jgi:hypothetical protein
MMHSRHRPKPDIGHRTPTYAHIGGVNVCSVQIVLPVVV